MSEVKIFKLSTGEDIIGQKLENKNTETTLIKLVFVIVHTQSKLAGKISLALKPYFPYSEEDIITIKNNNIISEANPKLDIKNSYNKLILKIKIAFRGAPRFDEMNTQKYLHEYFIFYC